jgi:hypothetical protein
MSVALENEESTNVNNIQEVMEEVEELADNQDDSTLELLSSADGTESESDDSDIGFETEVVETDFPRDQSVQKEMRTPEVIESKKILAVKKRQVTVQERAISKLREQLKSQVDRNRSMQHLMKGMQRHLLRIDKVIYNYNKQQEIVGRLQVRLNKVQKKLDQIAKAKVVNSRPAMSKKKSRKTTSGSKARSKLKRSTISKKRS